jgi:hypothetical protein
MKETINLWLSKHARVPGVLACGVRYPDQAVFSQTWSSDFPVSVLDNTWRCAADTFPVLQLHRLSGDWVRWVYERAYFYVTRRRDGICLGIFTLKDPLGHDPGEIRRLLSEFQALGDLGSRPIEGTLPKPKE